LNPNDRAWAVISPAGDLTWFPLTATRDVEALVAGERAPGALATVTVSPDMSLRALASDVALLFPESYPQNPVAEQVLAILSGGRLAQPWRGHVALVEYEQDTGPGSVGEWLWPCGMSTEWVTRITDVVAATSGPATSEENHNG
jgi:hypothetical protein